MTRRSPTKRSNLAPSAVLGWAALAPLLLAGCQSGAQSDLVARELRMQEDQIYAMEDYLAQYQQLLCQYRKENAALKRQLVVEREVDATPSAPRGGSGERDRRDGPSIEPPQQPGGDDARPRPSEIELPEVPPLEDTTSDEPSVAPETATASYGEVASAAGNTAAGHATLQAIEISGAPAPPADQSPQQVSLHGKVVANDSGGGPRLLVDVQPLLAVGRATPYVGDLSLMILATTDDGSPQQLARWDFTPDDVRAAVEEAANPPAMRFHLELPPDTPIDGAWELWVRLLRADGGKLLARAPLDLQQPGQFSSLPGHATPQDGRNLQPDRNAVVQVVHNESTRSELLATLDAGDGGWTTARPGEPANLTSATDEHGNWRAASEPLPVAMATSVPSKAPARPASHAVSLAAHSEIAKSPTPRVYKTPSWSPERPDDGAAEAAATPRTAARSGRPAWSPTR